jgi:hypothetical protein
MLWMARSGVESPDWMVYVPESVEPETEFKVTERPVFNNTVMVEPDWRVRPK